MSSGRTFAASGATVGAVQHGWLHLRSGHSAARSVHRPVPRTADILTAFEGGSSMPSRLNEKFPAIIGSPPQWPLPHFNTKYYILVCCFACAIHRPWCWRPPHSPSSFPIAAFNILGLRRAKAADVASIRWWQGQREPRMLGARMCI